ncbi:hypothetical protein [Klebsiella oxytoca]|uniref:hypothetical protein n=1 Tax=Klebsiella oxytoca TaxID=571 RepID=UPI00192DE916|nr:hypothetical protein [Klebsiella oxytoca]MBL6088523.1 hypothetical protein [Klebsiella oxytoca]MBL6253150.1 hypothetical protein [Klebsiella oxytoca]MBL6274511.1 hypothetical protein [Klebsiella oxytoca]MDU2890054.1 hypothetical protein [Klebsiella oxytoca]MEC6026013.1 hypothetical protein [Klebsiella oxytoca]
MNISTVNELIKSLESAGELSIKERKYLTLAKAYLDVAAENVQIKAMNDCLSEELRGYESDGAFEGPKMHLLWWQVETPATDRIYAEAEARGIEKGIAHLEKKFSNIGVQIMNLQWLADSLREGADK